MSRIDVQALVLAFENRIAALDKNPPNIVPQRTISLMLEDALEKEIKEHFVFLIKKDIKEALGKEFSKLKVKMIKEVLKGILSDSAFREGLQDKVKRLILSNIS